MQVRGLSFSPQPISTESVKKSDSRMHLSRSDLFLFISRSRKASMSALNHKGEGLQKLKWRLQSSKHRKRGFGISEMYILATQGHLGMWSFSGYKLTKYLFPPLFTASCLCEEVAETFSG